MLGIPLDAFADLKKLQHDYSMTKIRKTVLMWPKTTDGLASEDVVERSCLPQRFQC